MKKQYVEGYGTRKDIKEKIGMAGLVGVCLLAFAVTVVAGVLLIGGEPREEEDKIAVSASEEDVQIVKKEETEVPDTEEESPEQYGGFQFRSPCQGEMIKEYSVEMPIYSETLDDWRIHEGVDIGAPMGTVVCACADGVVKDKYDDFRYGATVAIEHDGGLVSIYSNLENTDTVAVGQAVVAGEKIGKIGDTTLFETVADTHIHVEILLNGAHVNPGNYFEIK